MLKKHHKPLARGQKRPDDDDIIEWFAAITTYISYSVLIVFGHIRDFLGKATGYSKFFNTSTVPSKCEAHILAATKGYAPLLSDFENFYSRRLYFRIIDCWNRVVCGPALSNALPLVERTTKDKNHSFQLTRDSKGEFVTRPCVNLGSYNYLGFADDWEITCKKAVMACHDRFPLTSGSSMAEGGATSLHRQLEKAMAAYIGKEDAVIFNMGWATNGLGLPSLFGKGCLIISDSLNHNSLVSGARSSGATVKVYRHNDLDGLESTIQSAIVDGQPKTHRPWKKILIVFEGIYSMEGEYVDLKEIVSIAKKFKCYTYLDEAHSIGAMGPTGRGMCEHAGVDPNDVDILMGTFTKSFGAMGGYLAASAEICEYIRRCSAGVLVDNSMTPIVTQQVLQALHVMTTDVGLEKIRRLRENSNYFRDKLIEMQFEVFGEMDSPVIPIMLYQATKFASFSRACLEHNLAVVVVGFPATPIAMGRARFCISAGHTKEDLDRALKAIGQIGDDMCLKYRRSVFG